MKVYTFFTDTHKVFLNSFIESFPFEDGFDLEIKYLPQECQTGFYHSNGWNKTMKKKIEYILEALINTDENSFFVHSDIDVQFFGKIKKDLESIVEQEKKDILFQNDGHQVCMGFFICKKNKNTVDLFTNVLNDLPNHKDDQFAVNFHIKNSEIKYGVLPERYYTIGVNNGIWNGEDKNFIIPNDILMHHSNFTIGIENKINLMKIIKNQING